VTASLANTLLNGAPLAGEIRETAVINLDIVPARIGLSNFDRASPHLSSILRTQIRTVPQYDYILIDTPPNLGMLLSSSLLAARYVLVPVATAPFALDGLDDLLDAVRGVQGLNEELEILGLLSTMYDARTKLAHDCRADLVAAGERHNLYVFPTIIHRDTRLEASSGAHKPIQLFDDRAPSVARFEELAADVINRLGAKRPQLRIVGKEVADGRKLQVSS
jgi:chromosome partitioning protein